MVELRGRGSEIARCLKCICKQHPYLATCLWVARAHAVKHCAEACYGDKCVCGAASLEQTFARRSLGLETCVLARAGRVGRADHSDHESIKEEQRSQSLRCHRPVPMAAHPSMLHLKLGSCCASADGFAVQNSESAARKREQAKGPRARTYSAYGQVRQTNAQGHTRERQQAQEREHEKVKENEGMWASENTGRGFIIQICTQGGEIGISAAF